MLVRLIATTLGIATIAAWPLFCESKNFDANSQAISSGRLNDVRGDRQATAIPQPPRFTRQDRGSIDFQPVEIYPQAKANSEFSSPEWSDNQEIGPAGNYTGSPKGNWGQSAAAGDRIAVNPAIIAPSIPTEAVRSNALAYTNRPGNYLVLVSTGRNNRLGNPLYELAFFVNGKYQTSFNTVSGRHYTQHRNRDVAGTEAPLPDGNYAVAGGIVPGTHPEVGGRFLPITPLQATGRSALGIHYDPSFESSNGEDGTAGCIALTSREEFDRFLALFNTYQPHQLIVSIQ